MENTARSDEERIPMELINGKIVMMSPRPRVDHTPELFNEAHS